MSHLFLSYSHKDRLVVEQLAGILENQGETTWWDHRLGEATPPDGWRNEIADKLFECRAMIVIVTENALNSLDVHREVEVVLSAVKKPIVPLWVGSPQPAPGRRGLLYALSVHQRLQVRDIESSHDIEECARKILVQLREPQSADRAAPAPSALHSLHSLSLPRIEADRDAHDEALRLISQCQADGDLVREYVIKGIRESIAAGAWTKANKIIVQMRDKRLYYAGSDGKLARMVEWYAWYTGLVDKGPAASIMDVLTSMRRDLSPTVIGDMPEPIRDVVRNGWFALIDGGLGGVYSALALPSQRAAAIKLDVIELLALADKHRDVLSLALGPERLPDGAIASLVPKVVEAYWSSDELTGPSLEVLRAAWPPSVHRAALEHAVADGRRAREIAEDTARVLDGFERCSSAGSRSQNLAYLRDQLRRQADLERFSGLDKLRNALREWDEAMDNIGRGKLRGALSTLERAVEFEGVGKFRKQLDDAIVASEELEAAPDLNPIGLISLADRRRLALEGLAASLAQEAPRAFAAIEAARVEATAESELLSTFASCSDRACPWGQEAITLERVLRDLASRPGRAAIIGRTWCDALGAIRGAAATVGKAIARDGRADLPELVDAARNPVAVLLWFKKAGKHAGIFESVLHQAEDAFATLLGSLQRADASWVVGRLAAKLAAAWREGVMEALRIGRAASQVRVALRSNAYDDAVTELRQLLPSCRDADRVVEVLMRMRDAEQEIAAWLKADAERADVDTVADAAWGTRCEALARALDGTFLEGSLDDRAKELADRVADHTRAIAVRKRLADVRAELSVGNCARVRVLLEAIDVRGLAADLVRIMGRFFDALTALDALAVARERARTSEARIDPKTGYAPDPVVIDAEERRVLELERARAKVSETMHASQLPLPPGYDEERTELDARKARIDHIRAYGQMVHEVRDLAASGAWEEANHKTSKFHWDESDLFDEAGRLLVAVQLGVALKEADAPANEPALQRLLAEREKDLAHPMLASWADRRGREVEKQRAKLRRLRDAALRLCEALRGKTPLPLDRWLRTPMACDRDRLRELARVAHAQDDACVRNVDAALAAIHRAAGPRNAVALTAMMGEPASAQCSARQRPATHHDRTVWALCSSDDSPAGLRKRIETIVGTLALLDGCEAYREQLERESGEVFPAELRDAANAGKALGAWLRKAIEMMGGVWGGVMDRGSWAALWDIERRAVRARVEAGGLPESAWPYGPLCVGLFGLAGDLLAAIGNEPQVRRWFGPLAHPMLIQGQDPLAALEGLAEPDGPAEAPGYREATDPGELLAADRRALRTQTLDMILGFRLSADQQKCAGDPVEIGARLREYAEALTDEYRGRDEAARVTDRMQDAIRRLLKHLSARRSVPGPPWTPERAEVLLGEVDRSLAVIEGVHGPRQALRNQRADLLYFHIGLYFQRWMETNDPDAPDMARMLELADQAVRDAPSEPDVFVNRAYLRWARVVTLTDPSKEEVEVQAEVERLLRLGFQQRWAKSVIDKLLQFNDIAKSMERQMMWMRNLQFGRERN
ncbi:MAG TPA: toll/interleukin-1 receptor domain-containing protein [Kofleriaceae bacterium]